MKFEFVGRQKELKRITDMWERNDAQFLVLYGRRRVGKTALLVEWIRRSGNRALYWVASPTSAAAQLRAFSQFVYNFSHPGAEAPEHFTYASWKQAFEEIAILAQDQRLALFIDEFTYLLEVNPGIAGELQNLWDHRLSQTNLFLCLSGSHLGMMKREFLSYEAPLYGRASAQIYLKPFFFGHTKLFFPKYSAVDRVAIYSIFGGVPAYWVRIDPSKSVSQTIKSELLTPNNLMQAEPRLLLQDFISETHNYISILSAIANGAHTIKEISQEAGLPNVNPPKYLGVLTDAGFVERRVPVTNTGPSREGRYHITDPYLRFYFRFLASRQEQLAFGVQEQALAEITRHMIDFIGKYTWEEICREWVLRAGAAGILPYLPDEVGSAWNSRAQVDVVGINSMEKTIFLGECKWTLKPSDRKVMAELVNEKTSLIIPSKGNWKVFFLGFSRSGWTSGALAYQDEINKHPLAGDNWISTGMQLVDLERLDKDMDELTTRIESDEILF
jgi:AAA+ ATPase superfamily predicted ATPase